MVITEWASEQTGKTEGEKKNIRIVHISQSTQYLSHPISRKCVAEIMGPLKKQNKKTVGQTE